MHMNMLRCKHGSCRTQQGVSDVHEGRPKAIRKFQDIQLRLAYVSHTSLYMSHPISRSLASCSICASHTTLLPAKAQRTDACASPHPAVPYRPYFSRSHLLSSTHVIKTFPTAHNRSALICDCAFSSSSPPLPTSIRFERNR
jgi:hypothetical protein